MRPTLAFTFSLLVVASLLCGTAWADAPRLVCLVSTVSGPVSLSPGDGPKKPLELFTRLREGERLELGRGAEAQLAFLQKGQRETWTGPATVLTPIAGATVKTGKFAFQCGPEIEALAVNVPEFRTDRLRR